MINFTSRTKYFISSKPTDMRNGREGLAGIVREVMCHPDQDSDIKNMCKPYTLEDNDGLMAELKSMHGKMAEMRGRLERDEITPDTGSSSFRSPSMPRGSALAFLTSCSQSPYPCPPGGPLFDWRRSAFSVAVIA